MNPLHIACILLVFAATAPVQAQQSDHRLGEHPAVIVKRLSEHQAYDYASKFYPHPAWLYLSTRPPQPIDEHPAVATRRQERPKAPTAADVPSKRRQVAAVPHSTNPAKQSPSPAATAAR
jgi:hypothetical protein